MIEFINLNSSSPYKKLFDFYTLALENNQQCVEAFLIASFDSKKQESDARYVNLKYVNNEDFIFFTNYNSPKSKQFKENSRIACVIYWQAINLQIRMKGHVLKTSSDFNQNYFDNRSKSKNALSISSKQSSIISSYDSVLENYNKALKNDLNLCPDYWGGYAFQPDYFEFWQGHDNRINKRQVFTKKNESWNSYYLEP